MSMPAFLDLNSNVLPIWADLILIFLSSFGAALTAVLGIGGGLIMIAAMLALMPAPSVVPVHGVVLLGSNTGRAAFLIRFIKWDILAWFLLGAVIGALLGGRIVVDLPGWGIRLAIASFILYSQWGPKFGGISGEPGPRAFALTGVFSTALTLFVGASGPIVTTIMSQTKLARQAIIGTTAGCMIFQHSAKIVVFSLGGFDWHPWISLIIWCVMAGILGTALGTRILHRVDAKRFRRLLKYSLTFMAFYLLGTVFFEIFI